MTSRAAVLTLATLGGCSFTGLFDQEVSPETCLQDDDCRKNAYADDDCVQAFCDLETGRCAAKLVDADGDGHAPATCLHYPGDIDGIPDDCDDAFAEAFPGSPATELCDGHDSDCDGADVPDPDAAAACNGLACTAGRCARTTIAEVVAGCDFTCARWENGEVWCWGNGAGGRLGRPFAGETPPGPAPGLTLAGTQDVAAGAAHACAVQLGRVVCWGRNDHLQAAQDAPVVRAPSVVRGVQDAVAVAAGGWHSCALLGDGTVTCWGSDSNGQLGDGAEGGASLSPSTVAGLDHVVAIAAAAGDAVDDVGLHTCALRDDGELFCWGYGGDWQLGLSGRNPTISNAAGDSVLDLDGVVAFGVGPHATCAVDASAAVRCWGTLQETIWVGPTPIADVDSGMADVAVGLGHACAIRDEGGIACWGGNEDDQLGGEPSSGAAVAVEVVTAVSADAPAPSPGARSTVATGCRHSCAVAGDDVLCWGDNEQGQSRGDTLESNSSPLVVGLERLAPP